MMVFDEGVRHRLHGRFEELLGAEEATAVMTALRFDGLASHDDMTRLAGDLGELRRDHDALRHEMASGFAELRGELASGMVELRAEMASGFAELRTELATQVGSLRGEFVSRSTLFAVIGAILATATLMAAVMAR